MGSRLCNTAGDKLSVTPFTFPNPGCLFFWFYPTSTPGSNVYLFAAVDGTPSANQVFSIFRRSSDGAIRAGFFREGVANREFGNATWTTNAWNSCMLIWGSSPDQMEILINGNDGGARAGDWDDAHWDTSNADYITFGSADGSAVSSCRIAQIHLWDAQDLLRQNNGRPIAAELHKGVDVNEIFPQNRVDYWPVEGIYSPEPDHSDNQRHLTVTGTTFVDEGPPLITSGPFDVMPSFAPVAPQVIGGLMPAFLGPIPGFGAG